VRGKRPVIVMGPFETEREAHAAALAVEVPVAGSRILSAAQNRQLIGRACEAAGVEMGRYDDRIVEWLAGFEDSTCAVIAGWVTRAHAAGHGRVIFDRPVDPHPDDDWAERSEQLRPDSPVDPF
jgi:hypothetical protein